MEQRFLFLNSLEVLQDVYRSVWQKRRVASECLSLVFFCSVVHHLTFKTAFHAENLRGKFFFRQFACQIFTLTGVNFQQVFRTSALFNFLQKTSSQNGRLEGRKCAGRIQR